jgi:segregation and condensation protein A
MEGSNVTEGQFSSKLAAYKIKIPIFEGPLDLLLYLIKKEELNIYDIPIARVAEQYLAYLELMEFLDLEIACEFIVMAATLLQIKSRMLLPRSEVEEEEEDPRAELARRLLEYKKFKDAAFQIQAMLQRQSLFIPRLRPFDPKVLPPPEEDYIINATIYNLLTAYSKALRKTPSQLPALIAPAEEVTVTERIMAIIEYFKAEPELNFLEVFVRKVDKLKSIVSFIALLEIARLGQVSIHQERAFGDIWVRKIGDLGLPISGIEVTAIKEPPVYGEET